MGVCICATNSGYEFYGGYGAFFNLRNQIAHALDQEFGENYACIIKCYSEEASRENDRKAEEIINRKHLDEKYEDVLDFLYMPDSDGKISYKTCKKIYDLIKDIDFGTRNIRYGADYHNDYEEFKAFLKECYSKRRNMRWS